ncbi:MAG: SH3 domain-containing protein [Lachnospiraceae bacterium]|nr:SH3 domain-containing protein [Lachnospiraceae bacterium]
MKRSRISFVAIGLACMVLLSSIWGFDAQATTLKGNGAGGLKQMSTSGLSGYENGQSLWVVNCKESISLRAKQSTSSDAILQIPLYGRVTYIADAKNGFLYVNYNGIDGYALAKYLDEFEPQIAIGEYMTVFDCKKSITLRKTASTKGAEICQIPLGAVVYVVKEAANGFYYVEYRGYEGYALASFLKPANSGTTTNKTGYYYGQPLYVVGVNESISLRAKASTSSEAILQIPLFGAVIYLEDASNGFVYVTYNGVSGYALAKYLDEFEPQIAIGEYMKVVNCKESVTLRKTASTSGKEICQIPLGSVVYAIKEGANGFFMVEYNGMQGFVLKKYLGSVAS